MPRLKIEPLTIVSVVLASLLFLSSTAWQNVRAQSASALPPMPGPSMIAPLPPYLPPGQTPDQPATLSSNLSYYFISGNTFTTDAVSPFYTRQVSGCVNQMALDASFTAPVHLPQASVVVSVTVYTFDSAITTTIGTAYFILNNGQGADGYTLSAASAPNTSGYQHQQSTASNPTTIDNQNDSYEVDWRKSGPDGDSPILGLCGVRLSYYAPLGATFLPILVK
jgi:hypothetical protein